MPLFRFVRTISACGGAALLVGLPICALCRFDYGVMIVELSAAGFMALLVGVPTAVAEQNAPDLRSRDRAVAFGAAISALIVLAGSALFLWWCLEASASV